MAVCGSSVELAMNMPGTVYSCPLSCEKCSCQKSSRPGDECRIRIASGCPPLRVPLLMIADARRERVHEHLGVRDRLSVVRDDEQIDGADRIGRAHQVELLVPGDVAQVSDAELAERDDAADRLRVLGLVHFLRLEARAVRVGLAAAGQRRLERRASRGDDAPVEAGDRDLVAGLRDGVLRLLVERRIHLLQEIVGGAAPAGRWRRGR